MTIDHNVINSLMAWAKTWTPHPVLGFVQDEDGTVVCDIRDRAGKWFTRTKVTS